jgi:hypothetical protein
MHRLKKVHQLKIYPAVGASTSEGHGAIFNDIANWETDVFRFLDEELEAPIRAKTCRRGKGLRK